MESRPKKANSLLDILNSLSECRGKERMGLDEIRVILYLGLVYENLKEMISYGYREPGEREMVPTKKVRDKLKMDHSRANGILKKLVKRGFLEEVPHEYYHHWLYCRLSEKGIKLYDALASSLKDRGP